ncbi:hypothetical protein Lser_V15G03380 [Lactuca serriola]
MSSVKVRSSLETFGTTVIVGQVTKVDKDTFWPIVNAASDKTIVLDIYTQCIEEDGRVFPVSDNSSTIVDCLLNEARQRGVTLQTRKSSTGYNLASQLGHSIIKPVPSIFTFKIDDIQFTELSGITIP